MCDRLLLTVVEAAQQLGLKRSKAYQLIQSGRLRSVKIDASRRVLATDLEDFVAGLPAEHDADG